VPDSTEIQQKPLKYKPRVPSHFFKRNDFYYFRVVLPPALKERLGTEVYMSLRTSLRSEALKLSQYLYPHLQDLLDIPEMEFKELRRRLNEHLQDKLDEDSINLEPRLPSTLFPGIEIEHPDFSYSDTCNHIADRLLKDVNSPDTLLLDSDEVLNKLVEAGIISVDQAKSASIYDKQLVTKLFYEKEILYHQILAKRSQGDFSFEESATSKDFSKPNANDTSLFPKNFIDEFLGLTPETIEQIRELDRRLNFQLGSLPKDQPSSDQPATKPSQKPIYVSTLIDKYVKNKVQENRWKSHTVSGHVYDLNLFLKVIKDQSIHTISCDIYIDNFWIF
jgi:hypothetical protein